MKSYSNCSNEGEINIDLPNLFYSKLCLSPSNDSINNLKDYGDLQKRTNSMTVVIVKKLTLSLMMLQVGVNCKKEDSSSLFIKLILLRYKSSIRISRD